MATRTEEKLLNIQTNRNKIRDKLVAMGLATSVDKLEALATAIESLINQGAVSITIKEGDTYTIPAGYHNGAGTVKGVAGGGNYKLEPTRTVTPTKSQQSITPADGFFGLESVIITAIPANYQDVSSVTAVAGHVLAGDVIVLADGTVVAGTMPDNGAVNSTIDGLTTTSATIAAGYTSGGTVTFDDSKIVEMLDAI